jgi:prepilin-type N-terminal cleavage/methylation domain-containing protein
MRRIESSSGFSLIEVMVASAILGCAVLSVAQLVATSTSATRNARDVSEATFLAWQKADELRSLVYGFDDAGAPITDAALQPSPAGTLERDTAGYVDAPSGTSYRRRWAVGASVPEVLVVRVRVLAAGREQELASVATLRSRRRP